VFYQDIPTITGLVSLHSTTFIVFYKALGDYINNKLLGWLYLFTKLTNSDKGSRIKREEVFKICYRGHLERK